LEENRAKYGLKSGGTVLAHDRKMSYTLMKTKVRMRREKSVQAVRQADRSGTKSFAEHRGSDAKSC
jgi:hypothetical protein